MTTLILPIHEHGMSYQLILWFHSLEFCNFPQINHTYIFISKYFILGVNIVFKYCFKFNFCLLLLVHSNWLVYINLVSCSLAISAYWFEGCFVSYFVFSIYAICEIRQFCFFFPYLYTFYFLFLHCCISKNFWFNVKWRHERRRPCPVPFYNGKTSSLSPLIRC